MERLATVMTVTVESFFFSLGVRSDFLVERCHGLLSGLSRGKRM